MERKEISLKVWQVMTLDQREWVCKYQSLSQEFISKIWGGMARCQRDLVCRYQPLNQKFISTTWEGMTWYQRDWVCIYQPLTKTFWKSLFSKLTDTQKKLVKDICFDFPNKEERIQRAKAYAKDHGLKIKNDLLYAFRNHGARGQGAFNAITRYKKGESYRDWHCDPRVYVPNSFGFGIWPKGNTPVTVPLKDFVVAVSREDGKARVYAFTVL